MRQSVSNQRTIAVLGASGATGRLVVDSALKRGHRVVGLVRRPDILPAAPGFTEHVWSDVSQRGALIDAFDGVDAVISALGGAAKGPTTVCTDSMRTVVPTMIEVGVSRLVVVSAHGVLETHDGSLYSRAVWMGVGEKMKDKESMEPVITSSPLEWTIVRPPMLRDSPATGRYRVGPDLPIRVWDAIGRADLAEFLVDEAENGRFARGYPRLRR
jgi:putative NADH-flavin reductase